MSTGSVDFGNATTSHSRHKPLDEILSYVVLLVDNFGSKFIQCGRSSPYSPNTAIYFIPNVFFDVKSLVIWEESQEQLRRSHSNMRLCP